MAANDIYPYTAWRLLPSYKPAQVTIVRRSQYSGYEFDAAGKGFCRWELHATKAQVIAHGRKKLEDQAVKIRSLEQLIEKRRAALDKAQLAGE